MLNRIRLVRAALFATLFGGITLMLWPLGQNAYGWWSQRTLQSDWQRAAKTRNAEAGTRKTKPEKPSVKGAARSERENFRVPASAFRVQEWPATRIVIKEIGLDAVVVQGMDSGDLRRGPGHEPHSALPGQPGNCVIAAHRNVFGAWFANLDRLWAGSEIELVTPRHTYLYHALISEQVFENDTSILQPTPDDAPPHLTLITCTLPAGLYRHVVIAELAE